MKESKDAVFDLKGVRRVIESVKKELGMSRQSVLGPIAGIQDGFSVEIRLS